MSLRQPENPSITLPPYVIRLERENARLREELAIQSNANVGLMEELAEAKRVIAWANNSLFGSHGFFLSVNGGPANEHHLDEAIEKLKTYGHTEYQRAEQSEARALEYKTEHAALLGTSQWQEVEIADLRDDVKRHMKIASECEERALAAEKDAGRFRWLLEDHEHPATRELRNSLLNRMQVMSYSAACTDIDAAVAGAKHEPI